MIPVKPYTITEQMSDSIKLQKWEDEIKVLQEKIKAIKKKHESNKLFI